jgi:hypothetical protein
MNAKYTRTYEVPLEDAVDDARAYSSTSSESDAPSSQISVCQRRRTRGPTPRPSVPKWNSSLHHRTVPSLAVQAVARIERADRVACHRPFADLVVGNRTASRSGWLLPFERLEGCKSRIVKVQGVCIEVEARQ